MAPEGLPIGSNPERTRQAVAPEGLPVGPASYRLGKEVALIVDNLKVLEHGAVFVTKADLPMMRLLLLDIPTQVRHLRPTVAEGTIAFLPGKFCQSNFFMDSFGRFAFDVAHHVGQAMGRF